VTVVHHDTFVKGKHADVKVRENPFNGRAIHAGRPNIKPEKTTVMPVVREIPRGQRPPESIREVHVKDLKQNRPLVKEKDASVLRPNGVPKKMPVRVVEKKAGEGPEEFKGARNGIEKGQVVKPAVNGTQKPSVIRLPNNTLEQPKAQLLPEKGSKEPKPLVRTLETPKERPAERWLNS
jgi:hypothetical protein